MAEPIAAPATGVNLLTQLLGQNQSTNGQQLTQQLQQALTQGTQTGTQSGTSSASTINTAELGPLLQQFAANSGGMDPKMMEALITSIFQEGARAVPELTGQFANSTGSRVRGNSGLNLALGDLNRQLSTQAVTAILQENQARNQTAQRAAESIAGNTRQTQQQGATQQANQGATTQQQTGSTSGNTQTQQRQQTGVNPNMAGLLGVGGSALNWLDKKGVFKDLFGQGGGGATGAGGITSATGGTLPSFGAPAAATTFGAPAASSGFLASAPVQSPVSQAPGGGLSIGGGGLAPVGGGGGGSAPIGGGGGFTGGLGGSSYGGLGSGIGLDFGAGAGSLGSGFFDLGSGSSLGNMGSSFFGSNPYDYAGDAGGITGIVGGSGGMDPSMFSQLPDYAIETLSGVGDFAGGIVDGIGGFLGGIGDWVGSFFADGGQVGNRGFGAPGDTRYGGGGTNLRTPVSTGNIWNATRLRNEMEAGLIPPPVLLQPGTTPRIPAGMPTGVPVTAGGVAALIPFLAQQMLGFANGGTVGMHEPRYQPGGYADGGQIQTGAAPERRRNQNYMGVRPQRERAEALNYEGYGAPTQAVGASTPAGAVSGGGGGGVAAISGGGGGVQTMGATPGTPVAGTQANNITQLQYALMQEAVARQQQQAAAEALARTNAGGGSGGVGEGASPTGASTDGTGPSGIGAAPPGTASAVSAGLSAIGLGVPGLSIALSAIAALDQAISAANSGQGIAGLGSTTGSGGGMDSSPTATSTGVADNGVTGIDIGTIGLAEGVGDSGGANAASADNAGAGTTGDTGEGDGAGPGGGGGAGSGAGPGWANGGLVRGPGTGTSDSIKVKSRDPGGKQIRYSDGEYVIPRDVVEALGTSHFDRLLDAFHTRV